MTKVTARDLLNLAIRNKKSKDGVWRNIKGWKKYDIEQEKIMSKKRDNFVNTKP